MFCPNCGAPVESNFCPDCGCDLRKAASRKTARGNFYLGEVPISLSQFEQMEQQLKAGEKLEAIKQIRLWTKLSLTDAKYIADHFESLDFRRPQILPHGSKPPKGQVSGWSEDTARRRRKRIGVAAFLGGYGVFQLLAGLVKPYMGKRK